VPFSSKLTSLRKDRGFKAALYARFGIPEYWIVNVQECTVSGVTISLSDLFA
jgi:Uma2 family endonuclease